MTYVDMYHARIRALQRVPGICPGLLVRGVEWAIKHNRRDLLHFVGWQGDDRCIWWGRTPNGQTFTAIANPMTGYVITIIRGWAELSERRKGAA